MKNKIVTIITPTYNRKDKIHVLYESLCNQTFKEFDWLVVDDGSNDNTADIISGWIEDNKISIRYIYKENGGKHTAINVGIKEIDTPLTFIVDSDDYLIPEAVETIIKDYENIVRDDICGIAYLRKSKKGGYLTNKLVPENGLVESFCECRYGRKISGDMAEVWFTRCLKEYPFPEFSGEKFLSEDVVWIQMSHKYKIVFYNKAIYMSDYLESGLTKNRRSLNISSPKGCMFRGEIQLEANLPIKYKIRAMLLYSVYGRFAKNSWYELFKRSKHKILYSICLIPSLYIYLRWK